MPLIETDLQTGDKTTWHPAISPIHDPQGFGCGASSLVNVSSLGDFHQKLVKLEALRGGVGVHVWSVRLDGEGRPIFGTETSLEEPYLLTEREADGIVVGTKRLNYVPLA